MIRRTKKELIQIFKKLRYEEGKEDEVHRLIGELDAKLGAKRLALFTLWSDLTRSEKETQ